VLCGLQRAQRSVPRNGPHRAITTCSHIQNISESIRLTVPGSITKLTLSKRLQRRVTRAARPRAFAYKPFGPLALSRGVSIIRNSHNFQGSGG